MIEKKRWILLVIILLLGLALRLYGLNWDQGFHLHPDERMLIFVAERIDFFDNLDPDFFNYGTLPVYLLKGVAQLSDFFFSTNFVTYRGLLYVGRVLSSLFDLLTVLLIYKIAAILFRNQKIALFSSFFYAVSFFPIQNAHFFTVDVFLTFFATLLIYFLLRYLKEEGEIKYQILAGVSFGAMLAIKFSALIFLPAILLFLLTPHFLDLKRKIKSKNRVFQTREFLKQGFFVTFNFLASSFVSFFLFMPYALLRYERFLRDVMAQVAMNSDPYVFPYTLQYVGTTPYIYYLKNIFFWGLGPTVSVLSLIGLAAFFFYLRKRKNLKSFLFFIFYILYFLIIGRSAVKYMRYMLPIYPFLTILAGYGIYIIHNSKFKIQNYFADFLIIASVVWSLMFVNIYSQKHTRIAASEWILENIPAGSTLAIEHWDDRVPILAGEKYNYVEMSLYEQPDDEKKWRVLNEKLRQTDYIIIASNRLYVPLQKLNDCEKYKFCYPTTAEYYRRLFNGQLGFKKVAEFAAYPKLAIGNWKPARPAGGLEIRDEEADESFTVYDHPKVMVFKKEI